MIVVFSYSGDAGTTPVLKWLDYFSVPYKRVNLEEEDYSGISLKITNKNNNQTFLIASHQLDHISKISDKVIVLKSGEIIDSIDKKYLKIETLNRLLVD